MWLIFPAEGYVMTCYEPHIQLSHECWRPLVPTGSHLTLRSSIKAQTHKSNLTAGLRPDQRQGGWGRGGSSPLSPQPSPAPPPSPTQTLPCPFLYSPPLPLQGWSNLGFNAQAGFTLSCGGCCQFLAAGMRPLPAILTQSTLLPTVFLSPSDSFPVSCDPFWGTLISHHGFLNQNSRKVTSVWLTLLQFKKYLLYLIEADAFCARYLLYGFMTICNHSGKERKNQHY